MCGYVYMCVLIYISIYLGARRVYIELRDLFASPSARFQGGVGGVGERVCVRMDRVCVREEGACV